MHIVPLLLAAAGLVSAQISGLVAPGNGAVVYFANNAPLANSNAPAQGRIYKIDSNCGMDNCLQLAVDVPKIGITQTGNIPTLMFTNYYDLMQPEVSRDGSIFAYTGRRDCSGSDYCAASTTLQTTLTGFSWGIPTFVGGGRLSGNGHYLFLYRDGTPSPSKSIVDLQTGETQMAMFFPTENLGYGRVIADDGTVVGSQGNELVFMRGTTTTQVSPVVGGTPGRIQSAVIDSAAEVVVYSLSPVGGGPAELHAYQTASSQDSVLAAGGYNIAPYVSADGTLVMFLSTASGSQQVWTVNTEGSALRQVTNDMTGVLSAAMSDDGHAAWFTAGSGRVFKLNLDTVQGTEELGRTPQVFSGSPVTPGSVFTIQGAGFSDETVGAESYPLPLELNGVSVTVGGIAAPLFSVSPTMVVAQAPWEVPAADPPVYRTVSVEVITPPASPFVPQAAINSISSLANPRFVTTGTFDPLAYSDVDTLAVHEDWDALVTSSDPARPNEIIHLYGTGFGTVDSPPATGMPSPANPPAHTIVPVTCATKSANIPVLFSGLAPDIAGYYQLDVQLPASLTSPTMTFQCSGEGGSASHGSFYASFPAGQ